MSFGAVIKDSPTTKLEDQMDSLLNSDRTSKKKIIPILLKSYHKAEKKKECFQTPFYETNINLVPKT